MAKRKMSPSEINDSARRSMALAAENITPPFGEAVSRTAYAELFSLIGKLLGPRGGSITFNIPDLRGRMKGY